MFPCWLKLLFSLYMALLIPYYWVAYTPWNFLYFCDIALFFTLLALWTEKPLLASVPAVAITLPQTLWVLDFLSGARLVGSTAYMFNPEIPLFVRALSSFHGWLPFLLLWMVWKLGYDERAFWIQCLLGWAVLCVSYFLAPAPPPPPDRPTAAVNLNYVYGFDDRQPQTWLHPHLWFGLLLVAHPLLIYWPTHWLFLRLFGSAR